MKCEYGGNEEETCTYSNDGSLCLDLRIRFKVQLFRVWECIRSMTVRYRCKCVFLCTDSSSFCLLVVMSG